MAISKKKARKDRKAAAAQAARAARDASHEDAPDEDDDEREMAAMRAELAATKDAHAKEAKYARINGLKLMNQWRKLMRLVKVEDLRKEIEIISQNHEREVDRKDAIIQMLDRDLDDTEEQYQAALRAHLLIVDRLIDLHNARLGGIEFEFEKLCAICA